MALITVNTHSKSRRPLIHRIAGIVILDRLGLQPKPDVSVRRTVRPGVDGRKPCSAGTVHVMLRCLAAVLNLLSQSCLMTKYPAQRKVHGMG